MKDLNIYILQKLISIPGCDNKSWAMVVASKYAATINGVWSTIWLFNAIKSDWIEI